MCTCVECAGYQQEAGEDAERFFPFEFEVWQDDVMVASASGPMHYAAQYQQDGPVRVFEVTRTLVRPNAPVHRREASDGTGS
jgi:hypothetical protein